MRFWNLFHRPPAYAQRSLHICPVSMLKVNCVMNGQFYTGIIKLEDLNVLRRSPDLFNNVKIGQGQLRLIRGHFLCS